MVIQDSTTMQESSESGVKFFFVSKGIKEIVKTIQYAYVKKAFGLKYFNLGFGVTNESLNTFDDIVNTKNGNDYEQVKSESRSLSAIQLLKK